MANDNWLLKKIDDVDDKTAEKMLMKLMERRPLDDIARDRDSRTRLVPMSDFIEEAKLIYANKGKVQGLSTGIRAVDEMTMGMLGGELIVIGGQSSHGKTQLSTNIAFHIAQSGKRVTFVTMEMTKPGITNRFMQVARTENIGHLQIDFQQASSLDHQDISFIMKKAKERGSEIIIIDHLHYFTRSQDNMSAEIGIIVKNFSEFAKVHNMPVVLISHTTKLRAKQRPEMQDLRDSSFIAQDADIVLMVWSDLDGSPEEVEVLLRKNRNRGLGVRKKYLYRDDGGLLSEDEPIKEREIKPNEADISIAGINFNEAAEKD